MKKISQYSSRINYHLQFFRKILCNAYIKLAGTLGITYGSSWDCFKRIGTTIDNCLFSNYEDTTERWGYWYEQISSIVQIILRPRALNKIFILQSNFICFHMPSIFVILHEWEGTIRPSEQSCKTIWSGIWYATIVHWRYHFKFNKTAKYVHNTDVWPSNNIETCKIVTVKKAILLRYSRKCNTIQSTHNGMFTHAHVNPW